MTPVIAGSINRTLTGPHRRCDMFKSQANKKPSITIVMPALNEGKNILAAIDETLNALDYYAIKGEIIVVNDGSTDNTLNLVCTGMEKDGRVKLINHEKPQGVGASFWDSVYQANGEIVTMFPGDNENDPLEALRYFALLEHVDIVIPFVFNREVRRWYRNILSLLYRLIINTTFRANFNYTNGTVLYRRSILDEFAPNSKGFFFQTEILIKAVKRGYLFAEVPYCLNRRNFGESKATSFPAFLAVAKGYLQLIRDIYFSKSRGQGKTPLSSESVSLKRHTSANHE